MGNSEEKNLGQEIQDMVQDAVKKMDFQGLNQEIGNTARTAIESVKRNIDYMQAEQNSRNYAEKDKNYKIIRDANGRFQKVRMGAAGVMETMQSQVRTQQQNKQMPSQQAKSQPVPQRQQNQVAQRRRRPQPSVDNKPAGRISSVIYTLLGGFFGASIGISIFILLLIGAVEWESGCILAAMILSPFFLGSAAMFLQGMVQSKRLQRFRQYVRILNGRTYAMLEEFAANIGKSKAFVRRDVQKMISLRMFPFGRLDNEGTCLILNNETWQQYMALKNQMEQQEIEEQRVEEQKKIEEEDPFQREVAKALKEGENYLSQIRAANNAIPGKEISKKLDDLELIIRKIFEQLQNHPEKIPEMNKFMEYYLPTTLKLVNAYKEFDRQALEGENISNGKREIEKTLDTINKAFLNLFDNLFADTAMDISTDISVLRTMLAQEGLTDSDFNLNKD